MPQTMDAATGRNVLKYGFCVGLVGLVACSSSDDGQMGGSGSGGDAGDSGGAGDVGSGGEDSGGDAGGGNSTGGSVAVGGDAGGGAPAGGAAGSNAGGMAGTSSNTGGDAGGSAGMPSTQTPADMLCPDQNNWPDPLPANTASVELTDSRFPGQTEGPVWIADRGFLLFTQFQGTGTMGNIRRFTPPDAFDIFIPDVGVNGLALDNDGQLLAASHDIQWISTFDLDNQQRTPLPGPSTYQDRPFNSVNDLVVRYDGNIYFSDPTWQQGDREGQDIMAFYRRDPEGVIERFLSASNGQPNGVILSPDHNTLYFGDRTGQTRQVPLNPDGSRDGAPRFLGEGIGGGSDGMAVDCAGNVYVTGDGGVHVFAPDGQKFGVITTSNGSASNAAFGGDDLQTLYITGRGRLHSIELNVPGLPY